MNRCKRCGLPIGELSSVCIRCFGKSPYKIKKILLAKKSKESPKTKTKHVTKSFQKFVSK